MHDNEIHHLNVPNSTLIMLCTFLITFSLMALPFVAYSIHNFRTLKHSVMIQKRHPRILYMQAVLSIFWFLIVYPLMVVDFANLDQFEGLVQTVITRISRSIFPWFSFGIFLTTAWRFWHIFYDLKYASSQKNSEWKYHLDPALVTHNFWLTHKKDYGTPDYVQKRCTVLYIVVGCMQVAFYHFVLGKSYEIFGNLFVALMASFPIGIILVLFIKIPEYVDHFFIKRELKIITTGLLISVASSTVVFVLVFFVPAHLVYLLAIKVFTIIILMAAVVSFWYIPKKVRYLEFEQRIAELQNRDNSKTHTPETGTTATSSKLGLDHIVKRLSYIRRAKMKLHSVLSHEKTFKIFMQHLAKEFSTECLLCFAEIVQYKFEMKKRFDVVNKHEITQKQYFTDQCPLADIVPLSAIVRNGFEQDVHKYAPHMDTEKLANECKAVCMELFLKYIIEGSELEVNISHHMRCRLKNLMSSETFWREFDIDTNALFCLFDDVAEQM
eukprot:454513_1